MSRYLWQSPCYCTYRCTDAAISGPIPSPGINVTVFLVAKLIALLSTSDGEIGSALLASFEKFLIIVNDNYKNGQHIWYVKRYVMVYIKFI